MASVESDKNIQDYGAVMADRKLPAVHVIFAEGSSMLLSEATSHVRQFFATWYSADHTESSAAAPEEVASMTYFPVTCMVQLIELARFVGVYWLRWSSRYWW